MKVKKAVSGGGPVVMLNVFKMLNAPARSDNPCPCINVLKSRIMIVTSPGTSRIMFCVIGETPFMIKEPPPVWETPCGVEEYSPVFSRVKRVPERIPS